MAGPARALLVLLAALAGCRAYDGPRFGGAWEAVAGVATASMTLELVHDPGAVLGRELSGTLVDADGVAWPVEADPRVDAATGLAAAGGEWRVTLRGGLTVVDDAGARAALTRGPIAWRLAHAAGAPTPGASAPPAGAGDERLVLDVWPVVRPTGLDPPAGPPRRTTFARRGVRAAAAPPAAAPPTAAPPAAAPPASPDARCAGCGERLEARWRVCPLCGRARAADGGGPAPGPGAGDGER